METKAYSSTQRTQVFAGGEQLVTSGGLTESPGGTGVSGSISGDEGASDARSVVGRGPTIG
jgi:hypothetical protein